MVTYHDSFKYVHHNRHKLRKTFKELVKKDHIYSHYNLSNMNEILLFYVTHPDAEHAQRICTQLLNAHLIACGNTYRMQSDYIWLEKHCQEEEYMTILKTHPDLAQNVSDRIEELHNYEVPCIIHRRVHCNESYYKWVFNETVRKLTN